ncbi:MAG: hypothetical protein JWM27_4271 [Gemmatimonadetes bacterium]|nr:hypothetical protein [Gemmatimonadota bacterium]
MSSVEPGFDCRSCGRRRTGEKPDAGGWCTACRAEVVRRATTPARLATGAFAALEVALLVWAGAFSSRFLVMWVAVAALLGFAAFKVARRVAFEVVRSRGVTLPTQGGA